MRECRNLWVCAPRPWAAEERGNEAEGNPKNRSQEKVFFVRFCGIGMVDVALKGPKNLFHTRKNSLLVPSVGSGGWRGGFLGNDGPFTGWRGGCGARERIYKCRV